MDKENIHKLAQSFLEKPYSDEYLNLLKNNHKVFLTKLHTLDERQIIKVIEEHPEYTNKSSNGWHALHYAALKNNQHIFGLFMKNAIENGLTKFPITEKEKRGIGEKVSFFSFCAANNCDKSYAKSLTYLSDPENQNYQEVLHFALSYNSPKIVFFVNKILGEDYSQKEMLTFFNNRWNITNGVMTADIFNTLKNHFNNNPQKFEDFGIDVTYKLPGKKIILLQH